jgi:hypothetical protein
MLGNLSAADVLYRKKPTYGEKGRIKQGGSECETT